MPDNPLLSLEFRIPFHRIEPEHVEPGIRTVLEEARSRVEDLVARGGQGSSEGGSQVSGPPRTYENTIRELDAVAERVRRAVTPVSHLMSVAESPELRKAYNTVLPEISNFWTWLRLHEGVWTAVKAVAESAEAERLEGIHARHLEKTVREFRRSGADLPAEQKERLRELRVELDSLEQRFSENVLDATADYALHIEDEDRLEGIPDHALRRFRAAAEERELEGWILTLDYPSYEAVVKHAEDRDLREEIQGAYTARCRGGEWDNRPVILRILSIRQEMSRILGYPHFPDYRLEEAMVGSGARARDFVDDLVVRTRPYFERDLTLLRDHAEDLGIDELQPWDVTFVKEKLRRRLFDVDDEELRPFFPLDRVLAGLFEVVRRVFGLEVEELTDVGEVWHSDVRCYRIRDEEGLHLGDFYADFFPRKEKRQGAWANDLLTGGPVGPLEEGDGQWQPHLGFIAANFTPPDDEAPALLTHREVETLFHEFGHLLHHVCSRVPVEPRAGLNVAWDWVEVPSQLMENWTWEEDAVPLFARHHETGEPLPEEIFHRMQAGRRFMGGWNQMRQLSFGSMDLALHLDYAPSR
ncbi:MAG: M3 family metallopeptidase, partial [Longimicrobiales bacterium]|nr:M3 family metallopeptidase [Longimicrobiales bacterium]